MQIYGSAQVHGPQAIRGPQSTTARGSADIAPAASKADTVEISDIGTFIEAAHNLPDIRQDRVAAIRQALADGTYDINSKLELAVDRLFDEIG